MKNAVSAVDQVSAELYACLVTSVTSASDLDLKEDSILLCTIEIICALH